MGLYLLSSPGRDELNKSVLTKIYSIQLRPWCMETLVVTVLSIAECEVVKELLDFKRLRGVSLNSDRSNIALQ